ncbi:MAG: hypothetical protein ABI970_02690, partial [Chloroflexota bacterium]
QYIQAQAYIEETLALCRELEEPWGIADAIMSLATTAFEQKNLVKARLLFQEASAMHHEINNQHSISVCLMYFARLDSQINAFEEAKHQLEQAITMLRTEDDRNLGLALGLLANVQRQLGQPHETIHNGLREALTIAQKKNNPEAQIAILISAAPILFADENYYLLGELIGLLGIKAGAYYDRTVVNEMLDNLRPRLDNSILEAALEDGRSNDIDSMIAHLQAQLD